MTDNPSKNAMRRGALKTGIFIAILLAGLLQAPRTVRANDYSAAPTVLAQASEQVSAGQIDKYIAVYKAMQRNRRITVKQAAAAQGLTLPAFRKIEGRIERDSVAREEVRRALTKNAQHLQQQHPAQTESKP